MRDDDESLITKTEEEFWQGNMKVCIQQTLKLWKPWNYESLITKTEEEDGGAGKDLEDSFLPLHVVAIAVLGAAQRKLSCLRWIIYSESCIEGQERVSARNKEGRGRPWMLPNKKFGSNDDKKLGLSLLRFAAPSYADNWIFVKAKYHWLVQEQI